MIRVALLDGDKNIRAGRRMILDAQPSVQIVFEEESADTALRKIPDLLVDVLIVDQRLVAFGGFQLLRQLDDIYHSKGEQRPRTIVTGAYRTDEFTAACEAFSVDRSITTEDSAEDLLRALEI